MAALWKQGVAADVQATAERYSDDALEDEVLAEIAAVALARMHTVKVRDALRGDPYGALPQLARRLAARVTVAALERVRTRHESRTTTLLELRSVNGSRRGLRVSYEATGGALQYSARIDARSPDRRPSVVLEAAMCTAEPRQPRVRVRPAGCRNLCRALGTRMDGEDCLYFLLSLLPTYDNEFSFDEHVLAALGLYERSDDDDDDDEGSG